MQKLGENLIRLILMIKSWIEEKMFKLRTAKVNGDSHFVAILVAIIVVIALAAVFKTQISNFITSIVGETTTQAKALF